MQLLWNNMYPQSELDNYKLQVDLLQEKLKHSEDNRQQLQKELQHILQRRSEHDKSVRAKLRQKYQSFLDEQEQRNERNQVLMQMLERIDQQSAALSARSERLKMMKLQYERYFAKVMQTQPVRYIPNAAASSAMTAEALPITTMPAGTTQIPVLLPTVAPQAPAAVQTTTAAGVAELKNDATAAATSMQPNAVPLEAITAVQSATALTPRMWTFAMATPTPAGLILTGAPSATMTATSLQSTTTPFELLQYPLGYGALLQQQQLQMPFMAAQPSIRSVMLGSRGNISQIYDGEMNEPTFSPLNKHAEMENASRSESTNAPATPELNATADGAFASSMHDKSTQRSANFEAESEAVETSEAATLTTHTTPSQASQTEHQSGKTAVRRIESMYNDPGIKSNISEAKLEDVYDTDTDYVPDKGWHNNSNESKASAPITEKFEASSNGESRPLLSSTEPRQSRLPANLSTAEEHKRKIAEIERRYGIVEDEDCKDKTNSNNDADNNITLSTFKRFSEIVKPESKPTTEVLPTAQEEVGNRSWQSHNSAADYTPKAFTSSASAPTKPISIDNIENAIYGELVNPLLSDDTKSPTVRTAAQGFFTELLGQQDTSEINNDVIKDTAEIKSVPAATENTALGYANYSASIDGNESLAVNNSEQNVPQNQTNYDTSNTGLYAPTATPENAYNVEATNNYAEYPTDSTTDPNATANSGDNQQLQEQQQQAYAQQDYQNYDATQYGNYDPNAYPGYIYDETTGHYILDPQYSAAEGGAAEATYAAQDYSEQQLPQEQLGYQGNQEQEANYTYEDGSYATRTPTASTPEAEEASATPAVDELANVPVSEPLSQSLSAKAPVEAPTSSVAPKAVKPTSILSTADKQAAQSDAQKKKKRVIFVDSSETDESSSTKLPVAGAVGNESDFDFSSGAETPVG